MPFQLECLPAFHLCISLNITLQKIHRSRQKYSYILTSSTASKCAHLAQVACRTYFYYGCLHIIVRRKNTPPDVIELCTQKISGTFKCYLWAKLNNRCDYVR